MGCTVCNFELTINHVCHDVLLLLVVSSQKRQVKKSTRSDMSVCGVHRLPTETASASDLGVCSCAHNPQTSGNKAE